MAQFSAAIFGATGYLGAELLRRLWIHPHVQVTHVYAADHVGEALGLAQPHLEGLTDLVVEAVPDDLASLPEFDVVFLALPHDISWRVVAAFEPTETRVIDCSGAFRVDDAQKYARFYGQPHPLPHLLPRFVYGLTELFRDAIRTSRFVASPGCFATSITLGLAPLVNSALLTGEVQTVGITGSSGAGTTPTTTTHHPARAGNLRTYKPLEHPHAPEVEQTLSALGARAPRVHFVPVASPLVRGIFATSFAKIPLRDGLAYTQEALDHMTREVFGTEGFVRCPHGRHPEVVAIAGSNYAEVRLSPGPVTGEHQLITCFSALDNLIKGGAGQAVQNMNLMLGLDEHTALRDPGGYP